MDPAQRRYQEGYLAGMQARPGSSRPPNVPATSIPATPVPRVPAATAEEIIKRELHPLDAFSHLLSCADRNVPPDAADRFRFRWFGLTYLAPERDGFRLRLCVPGGILRTDQVREAADIARTYASGCMRMNRHAGLDLETVALPDAPEALRRAEAAGLSARASGGDNVVAVLASPLAGLAPGELIDVGPYAARLEQCLRQGREFTDLPRSCVVGFQGGGGEMEDDFQTDIQLAAHKAGTELEHHGPALGFRIRVAGLGDLGVLVRPDQAIHAGMELLRVYTREADRTDRENARLSCFYGAWSRERCLKTLENRLGTKLARHPPPCAEEPGIRQPSGRTGRPPFGYDGVAVWPQKQPGLFAVSVSASEGRWLSAQWDAIAHLADIFGSGRIRLTVHQALFFPSVLDKHLEPLQEQLGMLTQP